MLPPTRAHFHRSLHSAFDQTIPTIVYEWLVLALLEGTADYVDFEMRTADGHTICKYGTDGEEAGFDALRSEMQGMPSVPDRQAIDLYSVSVMINGAMRNVNLSLTSKEDSYTMTGYRARVQRWVPKAYDLL